MAGADGRPRTPATPDKAALAPGGEGGGADAAAATGEAPPDGRAAPPRPVSPEAAAQPRRARRSSPGAQGGAPGHAPRLGRDVARRLGRDDRATRPAAAARTRRRRRRRSRGRARAAAPARAARPALDARHLTLRVCELEGLRALDVRENKLKALAPDLGSLRRPLETRARWTTRRGLDDPDGACPRGVVSLSLSLSLSLARALARARARAAPRVKTSLARRRSPHARRDVREAELSLSTAARCSRGAPSTSRCHPRA